MTTSFTFSDDQLALQRDARSLFTERSPLSRARELETDPLGFDPDLWSEMGDRGWIGLAIPEVAGGSGRTVLDLYPLYEEIGRGLVDSPLADTVGVVADLLIGHGTEDQQRAILPEVCAGRAIAAVAVLEDGGGLGPRHVGMRAERDSDAFVLTGTKLLVAHAPGASWFLCSARTGDVPGDGLTLLLADSAASGITLSPMKNIAGAALYEVDFDAVRVSVTGVIGPVGAGWSILAPALARAAVLQTASIVGAARSVLAMANQYAKDRQQFGQPIGTYQAVQYLVSDILIDLHSVDLLAKQAAYRISVGKAPDRQESIAIIHGKRAAAHLHRQAHEIHAGVGFMLDHDLNLFSRRSKYWENNFGDVRYYSEQLAQQMGTASGS